MNGRVKGCPVYHHVGMCVCTAWPCVCVCVCVCVVCVCVCARASTRSRVRCDTHTHTHTHDTKRTHLLSVRRVELAYFLVEVRRLLVLEHQRQQRALVIQCQYMCWVSLEHGTIQNPCFLLYGCMRERIGAHAGGERGARRGREL